MNANDPSLWVLILGSSGLMGAAGTVLVAFLQRGRNTEEKKKIAKESEKIATDVATLMLENAKSELERTFSISAERAQTIRKMETLINAHARWDKLAVKSHREMRDVVELLIAKLEDAGIHIGAMTMPTTLPDPPTLDHTDFETTAA